VLFCALSLTAGQSVTSSSIAVLALDACALIRCMDASIVAGGPADVVVRVRICRRRARVMELRSLTSTGDRRLVTCVASQVAQCIIVVIGGCGRFGTA
jgi:hypothetical protein